MGCSRDWLRGPYIIWLREPYCYDSIHCLAIGSSEGTLRLFYFVPVPALGESFPCSNQSFLGPFTPLWPSHPGCRYLSRVEDLIWFLLSLWNFFDWLLVIAKQKPKQNFWPHFKVNNACISTCLNTPALFWFSMPLKPCYSLRNWMTCTEKLWTLQLCLRLEEITLSKLRVDVTGL